MCLKITNFPPVIWSTIEYYLQKSTNLTAMILNNARTK